MSEIIPFLFDGDKLVRGVLVDGEPHFVGKDVGERLGYANASDAMKQHCRGITKRYPIVDSLGRTQKVRILSTPDVLRLIMGSTLPEAVRFERWVFEEVLPLILKTGGYTKSADPGPVTPRSYDEWTLEEKRYALAAVNTARKTFNQAVGVWTWARVGMPIPPEHLLPAWCRQRGLFDDGLTIILKPGANGAH